MSEESPGEPEKKKSHTVWDCLCVFSPVSQCKEKSVTSLLPWLWCGLFSTGQNRRTGFELPYERGTLLPDIGCLTTFSLCVCIGVSLDSRAFHRHEATLHCRQDVKIQLVTIELFRPTPSALERAGHRIYGICGWWNVIDVFIGANAKKTAFCLLLTENENTTCSPLGTIFTLFSFTDLNRSWPRAPVQSQQTRELISAR